MDLLARTVVSLFILFMHFIFIFVLQLLFVAPIFSLLYEVHTTMKNSPLFDPQGAEVGPCRLAGGKHMPSPAAKTTCTVMSRPRSQLPKLPNSWAIDLPLWSGTPVDTFPLHRRCNEITRGSCLDLHSTLFIPIHHSALGFRCFFIPSSSFPILPG